MTLTAPTAPTATRPVAETATDDVLSITDLGVRYHRRGVSAQVIHGVSLRVAAGRTTALVGQSGSGKSTIALAAAGLLPPRGEVISGAIRLAGHDIASLDRRGWQALRGGTIGFVPQDPLSSLDPLQRIGDRLRDEQRRRGVPRDQRSARSIALLERVGIADATEKMRRYPHELSGGQLQRVLIALAITGSPRLLIADEPTSALDVTVQRTILDLIAQLQSELGLGVLFITHDLALARDRADSVTVLHAGEVVESGPSAQVLAEPRDAYTRTLLANAPALSPDRYRDRLRPIEETEAAVAVRGLVKRFAGASASALDGVDVRLRRGSIHALVGESGSGKSTLARIVAGLTSFDEGSVQVGARTLPAHPAGSNPFAAQLQLVSQNPLSALDSRFTVARLLDEPLRLRGVAAGARRAEVLESLDRVALPREVRDRRPAELSGGQRQRVAIARALALRPGVLVLDEPTSALDVTVQAQITDLLMDLRDREGLSYLFISHDLSLVRQIAEEVSVLQHGRIVEHGTTDELFRAPREEYTRQLIAAIPGQAYSGDDLLPLRP